MDPSSLYPQPSPPGGLLGSNALQLVGALNQVNALKAFQQRQAAGSALQGAVGPNGFDADAALAAIRNSPDLGMAAPEAIGNAYDLRQKQIANSTAQFGLASGQNNYIQAQLAALAQKPDLSPQDVDDFIVRAARTTNIPSQILTGWKAGLPSDPKALRAALVTAGNAQAGFADTSGRVPVVDPATGQPSSIAKGAANYAGAVPTGQTPGTPEAIAANRTELVKDQSGAATIMAGLRPLQNALPLIEKLGHTDFGPGSEGFAQIKNALITAGIIGPNTPDDATVMRQEANKYLKNYAGQTQSAGRSDQALSQALGSNPNLDLTQAANLGLIKNQIGMDRMSAALPVAFSKDHPSEADKTKYLDYKSNYYQSTDPRAFQFDIMTPQERRTVIDSLGKPDSPAYQKFSRSYALAKQAGIFTPANGQ